MTERLLLAAVTQIGQYTQYLTILYIQCTILLPRLDWTMYTILYNIVAQIGQGHGELLLFGQRGQKSQTDLELTFNCSFANFWIWFGVQITKKDISFMCRDLYIFI